MHGLGPRRRENPFGFIEAKRLIFAVDLNADDNLLRVDCIIVVFAHPFIIAIG